MIRGMDTLQVLLSEFDVFVYFFVLFYHQNLRAYWFFRLLLYSPELVPLPPPPHQPHDDENYSV